MPPAPLPANETERLAALSALGIIGTPRSEAFDIYPILAKGLFSTPMAAVSLVEKDRQWFKASVGLDVPETPREVSFCAHAILNPNETLYVPDATKDPRFADNPLVTGELGIRFYAGVPLIGPSGHTLGALCVIDSKPREVNEAALEQLKQLSVGVSGALRLHASDNAVRKAATQESEARQLFASIFLQIGAPVAIITSAGDIITGNPAFQELVGYSAAELRSIRIDDLTPPEYRQGAQMARAKQLQDGKAYEIPFEVLVKGGRRVAVRLRSALLRDGDHRMRIMTLIPLENIALLGGQPVQPPRARDVGELRAVSLEAFRTLFGPEWERIAERALMRAEQIIRRRLGPDDVVSRVENQKFVIWFQCADADKNEDVLAAIVRDIRLRFTTEFGAEAAQNIDAVLVAAKAGDPKPSVPTAAAKQRPQARAWNTAAPALKA